jgi:hypothetical protein
MRSKTTLSWIGLALLGIAIAAAVAIAAGSLASRQIGLSSEPISAGDALVPANLGRAAEGSKRGTATATTPAPPEATLAEPPETAPEPETTVVAPPPPAAPSHEGGDDSGGSGGSGHGADD